MAIELPYMIKNGETMGIEHAHVYGMTDWREAIIQEVKSGRWRISALFGAPADLNGADVPELARVGGRRTHSVPGVRLYCVLANDRMGEVSVIATDTSGPYPSLTVACPQAHWFEREIYEQWGIRPDGHPWLKPVRDILSYEPFYRVSGDEVHEVAVGPVHAGVIEPGHFRFQCHGEEVYHLEIALGYQHRGVERKLRGGPGPRTLHYMETLAGDTSVGHAWAYCQALESLAGVRVPERGLMLRAIALELERLANHTGDLGALAGDVGYLPTASFCGRLRGDFLNMSALLCGSRFGRGMLKFGGTGFDLDSAGVGDLAGRLRAAARDVRGAVELLFEAPSVLARFEGTGIVSQNTAIELGLVGVAARACGLRRDVRQDFGTEVFKGRLASVDWTGGDVYARAYVRWLEIQESILFIEQQLKLLSGGGTRADARTATGKLRKNAICVSLIEGWRGEICHVAITDERGRLGAYKVVDPSFHNWIGLALALRGGQISDFPLCNKSFNLSYCGHDL